ncbi:MAG TPA: ATP-binding protein [Croceibacterium sp.]|nr:ATP-binding protein [Croceibacterium sp.]
MNPLPAAPSAQAQIAGLSFAVLLLDPAGAIREVNPVGEDMLGASAKRLVRQQWLEVVEVLERPVAERLRDSEGRLTARGLAIRVGEREMLVNLTLSPLAAHPGWRVVTMSDARQGDRHGEGDHAVGLRGPAILAHEIKNPLAAIRGAGQLVARKLGAEDRHLTTLISEEVDRIAGLIDRMQRLGREEPEPNAPVNLHHAIRRACEVIAAGDMAGVTLREEFDPSLPPVLANGEALVQVLINLVANARDACAGAERPEILIRTRFVSGLALNVVRLGRPVKLPIEIAVCDNGPGVDPGLGDHIFEPFVTSKKNGQGLGLALVAKLVRDMNGRISYARDEKAGQTCFRMHLAQAK